MRKSSARPTERPGAIPKISMTGVTVERGTKPAEVLEFAKFRDPSLQFVHALCEDRSLSHVPRRTIAPRQFVELVEKRSRVTHVATHRRSLQPIL